MSSQFLKKEIRRILLSFKLNCCIVDLIRKTLILSRGGWI